MSLIIENKIKQFISEKKIAKPKEIEECFNLHFSTARRYLINLENQGYVKRRFGEIIYCGNNELNFDKNAIDNLDKNKLVKNKIAKIAASFVEQYKTIYLDSGSCCYYMLDYLDKNIEIYTNSLLNAKRANELGFVNVYILGGKLKQSTLSIVNLNETFLKRLNFQISFLGLNGINDKEQITTPEINEGKTKQRIYQQSDLVVCLCEKEKFNKTCFYDFSVKDVKTIIVTDNDNIDSYKNKIFIYVNVNKY